VPRDDAAAVEALTKNHVVDGARVEVGDGRAHHVFRQLVGIGVAQRALHRGPDGGAQGGHYDGFWHRVAPFDQCENAILSDRECQLQ
jgi:hypothetical protein